MTIIIIKTLPSTTFLNVYQPINNTPVTLISCTKILARIFKIQIQTKNVLLLTESLICGALRFQLILFSVVLIFFLNKLRSTRKIEIIYTHNQVDFWTITYQCYAWITHSGQELFLPALGEIALQWWFSSVILSLRVTWELSEMQKSGSTPDLCSLEFGVGQVCFIRLSGDPQTPENQSTREWAPPSCSLIPKPWLHCLGNLSAEHLASDLQLFNLRSQPVNFLQGLQSALTHRNTVLTEAWVRTGGEE
jgi:hypothetical protein